MEQLTPRLTAILARYMRTPVDPITAGTTLASLDIDRLDLPMIMLDIEDAFDIHVRYDDHMEDVANVGDLADCVAARIEEKASFVRQRASIERVKRSWFSTEAEPRR